MALSGDGWLNEPLRAVCFPVLPPSVAAVYLITDLGSGFTLTPSEGKCAISSSNALTGSSSVMTRAVFTSGGTELNYGGSSSFYVASVPTGTTQATVYMASNAVSLKITCQAIQVV